MYGITTVTTKGQVTIPEDVRTRLGIQVGDKIRFDSLSVDRYEFTAKVVSAKDVIKRLAGALYSPKIKYVDINSAREKAGQALGKYYEEKNKKWEK